LAGPTAKGRAFDVISRQREIHESPRYETGSRHSMAGETKPREAWVWAWEWAWEFLAMFGEVPVQRVEDHVQAPW
jgi:hypothetical protein